MAGYTEEYIERCFQTWFSLNQPNSLEALQEAIPESPDGGKPSMATLRQFKEDYAWHERADVLNSKAIERVESVLVDQKYEMLLRQAETAQKIGQLAEEHLLTEGFDNSSSAVNALKWASEEERTVRGVSEMMIKISRMTPDELMKEAAKLLKRNSEAVDAEVIEEDSPELGVEVAIEPDST